MRKMSIIDFAAVAACLLFIIIGLLVSLHRHWQYESTFTDFGYYDQAIWKVSRFQAPETYHFVLGKINTLGDHAAPSIFIISPLYWLTDRSEMILIVQAIAVGLSGIFLYDIGRSVLKNKLVSFSILSCYFLFVGLQNAVITDFHELTVMTFPLMMTFWAIIKNKITLYFASFILLLGFKEVTAFLGVGMGIALILLKKEWRKYGIASIILSLIWGYIAFKIIIPTFSNGRYLYNAELPGGFIEKISAFVDQPQKRDTLLFSFLNFSFLPFFAPQFWLVLLQDYATRFLPLNFVTRWSLGMHYNAQSAVLLAVSSVYGLKYLIKFQFIKKYIKVFSILFILNALFLFRFKLNGPFLLAINPAFYTHTNDFIFLNDLVKKIPKDASVMTHNNLATRFTHQEVQLLTKEYTKEKPDYILIDNRGGQSPNNFFGSKNMENIFSKLLRDKNYAIFYKTNEQYIFKRK